MSIRLSALCGILCGFLASASASAGDIEYLGSGQPTATPLPFSEAVRVGRMLYLSGQIGNVPGTMRVVAGGLRAETKQAMDNIKAVLARHGYNLGQVVKCTVMLTDMSEWASFNEVYKTYFTEHLPARSAIGAGGLALGAHVEVECWAAK